MQEEEEASGVVGADQPPSLLSIGSFTAPFSSRKPALDRKISVMSNYSTVSEDSLGFENALEAATSAVGIARAASTRTSKRSKRSVVRMDSEAAPTTGTTAAAAMPELEEELVRVDSMRIMRMQMKDWPYVVIGILGSIVMGAAMPVYALLFGEVLGVLRLPAQQAREECIYFCGLFVATGVTAGIAIFLQICMFCIAGESLTQRMRKAAFAAMLRQEMGWFDRPLSSPVCPLTPRPSRGQRAAASGPSSTPPSPSSSPSPPPLSWSGGWASWAVSLCRWSSWAPSCSSK